MWKYGVAKSADYSVEITNAPNAETLDLEEEIDG
jgi:hypothetical protein